MKFTHEKVTTLFYVLAATLLVAVLGFFYLNNQKVRITSDWVEHTQEVLRTSDAVLLDIISIETGARGFVLTWEDNFLVAFNHSTI
jgi:CHASE3 domain sensor protein